jgi:hypothetical protein
MRVPNADKVKLFDSVVLLEDLPDANLSRGNVGAIVEVYNNGEAFEVEFVASDGSTYGLTTLRPHQFLVLEREPKLIAA